jgi:hypothetical protein
MKARIAIELIHEGYRLFPECDDSPVDIVNWSRYRPDLFGYRKETDGTSFVFVECETHPNLKRLESKNYNSAGIQQNLFNADRLRRILAVPRGRLGSLDLKARRKWEIWVVGSQSPLRIPQLRT